MDNRQYESNWANACRARGLVSPYVTQPDDVHGRKADGHALVRSRVGIPTVAV
jgi:hypothetical protein